MSEVSITVLMTVFNGGADLEPAVRGILGQTFGEFEFLIVDDASTDDSGQQLERFANEDSRIRLLRQENNRGQTACLNLGLREARGRWVARMDADDLTLPTRLERLWQVAKEEDALILIGSQGWICDEEGRVTGTINVPFSDPDIRWCLPLQNPFIHTAVLFRRDLPDGTRVQYDEDYRICQDWALWSRLLAAGKGRNLPDRLIGYRHHGGSLSHSSEQKTREEADAISLANLSVGAPEELAEAACQLADFRAGRLPGGANSFRELRRILDRSGNQATAQGEAYVLLALAGAARSRGEGGWALEVVKALMRSPTMTLRLLRERLSLPTDLFVPEKLTGLAGKKPGPLHG